MNDYRQPDFFRFGSDSLELIRWVKAHVPTAHSILDLGAGSGILGIELAGFFSPKKLTLLEVQGDYLPFLEINLKEQLTASVPVQVIQSSFGEWKPREKYDLIVSNPPYYLPGRGQASPDERRNLARTFKLDNWKILFALIEACLEAEGRAYLVIKNDTLILHHLNECVPSGLKLTVHPQGDIAILELARLNVDGDQKLF